MEKKRKSEHESDSLADTSGEALVETDTARKTSKVASSVSINSLLCPEDAPPLSPPPGTITFGAVASPTYAIKSPPPAPSVDSDEVTHTPSSPQNDVSAHSNSNSSLVFSVDSPSECVLQPAPPPSLPSSPNHAKPLNPLGFFGQESIDDLTKCVADFLFVHANVPHAEVEAKVGLIIDKSTNGRIRLPVRNAVVLEEECSRGIRFESAMSMEQHRLFNHQLNKRFEILGVKEVQYAHTKSLDSFHHSHQQKIRVTKELSSGRVIAMVEKQKIANLHVHFPRYAFDCRITVSSENPVSHPPITPSTYQRAKDRISYQYQSIQFDLTQVQAESSNAVEQRVIHELEVEFTDMAHLQHSRAKLARGHFPNDYLNQVSSFVTNLRTLLSKVRS